MKTTYLFVGIFLLFFINKATAQDWLWAKQAGGSDFDWTDQKMLCKDIDGNVYFSGTFYSNPCYFETDSLVPNGIFDFYIAKYNSNGDKMWVMGIHSMNSCLIVNSIFISGYFYGAAIFGNDTLVGSPDANFYGSLDTSGTFNWVKKSNNFTRAFASDDGYIYAEYSFPTAGMIDTLLVNPGIWLAKLDQNGDLLWAQKKFNANMSIQNYDVLFTKIIGKKDNIYAIGTCSVDSFTVDNITVFPNFSSGQYIIACFDSSGLTRWVKPTSGSSGYSSYADIVVDTSGGIYVSGPFEDIAIFNQDTLQSDATTADFFIARYDSSGNNLWAVRGYASNYSVSYSLSLDIENGIYAVGSITDSAILCNDTIIATAGNYEGFIERYNSEGNCIAVRHMTNALGGAILCNDDGSIYITGNIRGSVNFSGVQLNSMGNSDIFIAKSNAITGQNEERKSSNELVIYANPSQGTCNVTIPEDFKHEKNLILSVYDNKGNLIQQGKVQMNGEKVHVNLEAEAKGIYNVTLSNGKKSYGGKIVFE
ncbi:MAG: T9SS type A sorting domain-containing protein [Bacteroidetes bacterium]|nr:T9SS type A sorting domain-containing protein [Bacteroidota bacterium]